MVPYFVSCITVLVAMHLQHQGGGRFSASGCDNLHPRGHAGLYTLRAARRLHLCHALRQEAAGVVFSAFELRVDMLMAMQLNGSEVEALLPPAKATNVSASGALLISAILFRCAQGTAWPPCHWSSSKPFCVALSFCHAPTGTRSRRCGCLPTLPTRPRRMRLPCALSFCVTNHCRSLCGPLDGCPVCTLSENMCVKVPTSRVGKGAGSHCQQRPIEYVTHRRSH